MKFMGVLFAALLLAGCSGEKGVDQAEIEGTITRQMQRQLDGKTAHVACPDDIKWQAGRDFHCIAKASGQSFRVTVTMENDDDWTWTTDG